MLNLKSILYREKDVILRELAISNILLCRSDSRAVECLPSMYEGLSSNPSTLQNLFADQNLIIPCVNGEGNLHT